jgi:hypothetical protein
MCSTPFGITAVITPGRDWQAGADRVLNAFRHHCCHHIK